MCRQLAYLGDPVTLDSLLYAPEHSLEHQSYAPGQQRYGTVNADGWGIGWYDLDTQAEPARYRSPRPIWTDRSFASMAPVITTTCTVAAVRSATPPAPSEESGAAPFASGPWLFAHNGAIDRWSEGLGEQIRRELTPKRAAGIEGGTDSEVLFASFLDGLDRGASPADALAATIARVATEEKGRMNFLVSDGRTLLATVWGDTLFECVRPTGTLLASEPLDDDPAWASVPDLTLVTVDADGPVTHALEPAGA
jgi:glutamine amidotransferase